MPRARAPTKISKDGERSANQPKSCWKDKLTDQQLDRKRAADRALVRENRNRARRTIAVLQERIELLSSQQPDRVIADLMQENAALERAKTALRDRLQSVCVATGISREETHELIARLDPGDSASASITGRRDSTGTGYAQEPLSSMDVAVTVAGPSSPAEQGESTHSNSNSHGREARSLGQEIKTKTDLTVELNFRMRVPNSPSPFPGICVNMDQTSCHVDFSDDELLESIMLWRRKSPNTETVFGLASQIFHVDRTPGYLTQDKLSAMACIPSLVQLVVQDLESSQSGLDLTALMPPSHVPPETTVSNVKKELLLCAFEAIKHWKYCSQVARITMFWALYRMLMLLVFPTPKNLSKCPVWYRPLLVQMWNPHPSFIDFIPWPRIRAHLVHDWQSYQAQNLYSSFVENFDIHTPLGSQPRGLFRITPNGSELEIDPRAEKWFQDLSSLRMHRGFVDSFPEFARFVHISDSDLEFRTDFNISKNDLSFMRIPRIVTESPPETSAVHEQWSTPSQPVPSGLELPLASTERSDTMAKDGSNPNMVSNSGPVVFNAHVQGCLPPGHNASSVARDDGQSANGSVETKLSPSTTAEVRVSGTSVPMEFTKSLHRPVEASPAYPHKDARFGDFNPMPPSCETPGYQIDPSLMEWQVPVPWSMQLDDSRLGEFLFSV
ncbi:uncharacterized protein Z518_04694 [Rhinocladiella mackenziei CBS 650.93]|uniref:BZIP domain-containing protein n=1 Tax=Rhinocladiella mackenziei CBS 650.93 TaxID=1442369 RepID=A0A0D2H8E0_9EURO|nr:uncharacterized protein Z518_04694 [Rhinocladiella mackenziei CBS 650.93]KIX06718.1 hypothetical protein Z518_04694 [Rhinocladiella mackenziei CBS 650.93]